jgi:ABC-type multidrug transport system fused ATPase/permease subunit
VIDFFSQKLTGSVNTSVRREVRNHLLNNAAARHARYNKSHRILRRFFSLAKFGHFIFAYATLTLAFVLAEICVVLLAPEAAYAGTMLGSMSDLRVLILNISSYLITAQVGVLGVISLALALVTLIAQKESSAADVQVYYHQSLAFEVVASCIALLAVLSVQLLWPAHVVVHLLGYGTHAQTFKLALLWLHVVWLVLNLCGLAHFIAITFGFVQQSEREKLRERFTAHVSLPEQMTKRFREQIYGSLTMTTFGAPAGTKEPSVMFGFDFGAPYEAEVISTFKHPVVLHDVRLRWVGWVVRRWAARSKRLTETPGVMSSFGPNDPTLWFTPTMQTTLQGRVVWCRRRDGCPLTVSERFVLRRAFCFRRAKEDA